jgi:hypothetical protein
MMDVYLADPGGRGNKDLAAIVDPARAKRCPVRILLSYHYYKDEDIDALMELFDGIELDVFADSGAYSAMTTGNPVNPTDYIAWAKRWSKWFNVIAGPDVIGDPVATTRETERMLGEGFTVPILPTFHVGEDWAHLAHWIGKVDYLALGGMVPYTRRKKLLGAWLQKAFGMLPTGMRVHGFGMTTWDLLTHYPWYSVDSSSWTAGFRYAQLLLFDSQRHRMVQVAMNDRMDTLKHASLLAQYGMRPTEIQAAKYNRDRLVGVCVESWQRVEEWLGQRHQIDLVTLPNDKTPNSPAMISKAVRRVQ